MLNIFLSIFSAILLILSFPKPNLGFLAWFALIPWFFAIHKKTPLQAFLLSYLIGLVFFSGVIYWVNYVSSLGFILLVLYLALYFAVFGLFFSTCSLCRFANTNLSAGTGLQPAACSLFIIPCIWVALEYIRSHLLTGFGWALLGYSQYSALPIIQISDITGSYGVSFLIVLVNVGIWQGIVALQASGFRPHAFSVQPAHLSTNRVDGRAACSVKRILLCVLFPVILALSYGYYKLNQPARGQKVKVAVVQGNIPQGMKWDPQAREYILEKYFHLTKQAALSQPQLIIWPETSVPGYLESDAQLLRKVRTLSKKIFPTEILVGTPQEGKNKTSYNSASLLSGGKVTRRYDKLHLVPFGEFMPWPAFFSRFSFAGLVGQFSPGEKYTVFALSQTKPKIKFSALICFEDTLSDLARRFVQKGAQFLVNITNDAWFGDSSELEQHLQASVFRAVENRVNLARSANTGVSCFISPRGEILSRTSEHLTQDLQIVPMPSFYTAFGDIFAWLCLTVSGFALLRRKERKK